MLRAALALLVLCTLAQPGAAGDAARLLVGNKSADSVWVLDTGSGARLASAPTGRGPHELAIAPAGDLVVIANYGTRRDGATLSLFDLPALAPLGTVELGAGSAPHGLAFLPDGRVLVTAEGHGELLVVDPRARRVLARIAVGAGSAHMVAAAPGGELAWVTNIATGTLSRVDLAAGRVSGSVRTGEGAEGVAASADGREVWVTNRGDDTVSVIDAATLAIEATLPAPGFPIRVAVTPDGRHALVSRARAARLGVYDTATRREVADIALAEDGVEYRETLLGRAALPVGVTVDPSGRRAFVALTGADQVAVIDTSTWSVTARWATGREPDALGVPPR